MIVDRFRHHSARSASCRRRVFEALILMLDQNTQFELALGDIGIGKSQVLRFYQQSHSVFEQPSMRTYTTVQPKYFSERCSEYQANSSSYHITRIQALRHQWRPCLSDNEANFQRPGMWRRRNSVCSKIWRCVDPIRKPLKQPYMTLDRVRHCISDHKFFTDIKGQPCVFTSVLPTFSNQRNLRSRSLDIDLRVSISLLEGYTTNRNRKPKVGSFITPGPSVEGPQVTHFNKRKDTGKVLTAICKQHRRVGGCGDFVEQNQFRAERKTQTKILFSRQQRVRTSPNFVRLLIIMPIYLAQVTLF